MDREAAHSRPSTRHPQLNALKTFEVAARHESFVRAAQELFVTHGAVSKQIRALEAELGEPLFARRNRAVFLTERGRQLSANLSMVFSDLATAIDDFRSHRREQPLVVSCEPTLCLKLLIPKLADLKNRTGLDVRVMAAGGEVDFRRDHVDLAIRRNDFPIAPDVHARTLAPEVMGLVCSPAVAAEIASASRTRFPALHTRSRPDAWTRWKRKQATSPKLKGDITYEHFYLAIEATLASQGVALASLHMVAADIEQGRLRAISAFEPDGTAYLALTHRAFAEDARLSAFAEWFASVMNAAIDNQGRGQDSTA